MSWATGLMVYLVIWWTVLFAVLPLGVRKVKDPGKGEERDRAAMNVTAIEHVLVLSDDIEATRDFYCQAVGLRVGERPQDPHAIRGEINSCPDRRPCRAAFNELWSQASSVQRGRNRETRDPSSNDQNALNIGHVCLLSPFRRAGFRRWSSIGRRLRRAVRRQLG